MEAASTAGEHFGKMHRADGQAGAGESALQLHEAARINGNYRSSPRTQYRFNLSAGHRARHFGKLHRKCSTETAALLGGVHLAKLEPADFGQQRSGRLPDTQVPQGVATIVVSNSLFEPRTNVFHLRN